MTYEEFEDDVLKVTGINMALYKKDQMQRRISTFISRQGLDGYQSYLDLLKTDSRRRQEFLDFITIHVTDFFRTTDQWEQMADLIIPSLPDDALIWSSACSTGEEPYSLAISIAERRPLAHIRIIASDIDRTALSKAEKGEYQLCSMSNVKDSIREKYFTKTDSGFKISNKIRSHVEFRQLDLLADEFPKNCDLIACRNVLIYFTDVAKNMLYRRFNESLRPGGCLFTGNTEQIIRCAEYNFTRETRFLFRKP